MRFMFGKGAPVAPAVQPQLDNPKLGVGEHNDQISHWTQECEEKTKIEQALLEKWLQEYRQELELAKTFQPVIHVTRSKNGNWIQYQELEFNAWYVERIWCSSSGGEPYKAFSNVHYPQHWTQPMLWPAAPLFYAARHESMLEVKMISGQSKSLAVPAALVDLVLGELVRIWREER